jgi:hypothetical protein
LRFIDYSLAAAVRVGIPSERMLNFISANALREWAETVRERSRLRKPAA